MNMDHDLFDEVTAAARPRKYDAWILAAAALVLIGAAAFFVGALGERPQRAWQAFLVNFMFWFGIAGGSLMFSAMLIITRAVWGRSIKRLAEAPVLFLPVAFVLFGALYFGREHLFAWIHEPLPGKAAWLNVPFFFSRDGVMLFVLAAFGLLLTWHSVKADLDTLSKGRPPLPAAIDTGRHGRLQMIYANIFGLLYAVIFSLLAFDLMMSLSPHWYSTLFGAYYFVGSFFTGLAFLMLMVCIAVTRSGLKQFIFKKQLHSLGMLMFGFCVMTADFFYVQFLVIWYGNIPEETRFMIERIHQHPWNRLTWVVLFVAFIIPFAILLFRRIKMMPLFMIGVSVVILTGMWLEKILVIAPSIWPLPDIPIGWLEIFVTAGFAGLMGLCILLFLSRFPVLPVGDPIFYKTIEPAFPMSTDGHG